MVLSDRLCLCAGQGWWAQPGNVLYMCLVSWLLKPNRPVRSGLLRAFALPLCFRTAMAMANEGRMVEGVIQERR